MTISRTAAVALLTISALVQAVAAGSALANGAGAEIFRDTEGPYELVVRVQPEAAAVGAVHVTFEPTTAGTTEPVPDAEIRVLARDEDGLDRYVVRAVNTPLEKRYYDANLTFESAGGWTLIVEINSDQTGAATFEVPMQVQEQAIPPRSVAGTVAWLLATAVLVGGALFVWYRSRGALRGRKSTD